MTARILDVTPVQYHADPCATPSLSSSIAHVLIAQSSLHAYCAHPRLGGTPSDSSAAMNDGELLHRLLLGKGRDIEVVHFDSYKTNAAKDQRDAARAAGKIPVKVQQFETMSAIAARLLDRCRAKGIKLEEGDAEVAVEWTDSCADGPVLCRSMFDQVDFGRGAIIDVKKVRSAHPREVARHFVEYGYDIQHEAYRRALAELMPELEGRVDVLFLFCEIEPPYEVVPSRPDGALREIGVQRWERAVQKWHECLSTGVWPGYADGGVVTLEAPAWDVSRELGSIDR